MRHIQPTILQSTFAGLPRGKFLLAGCVLCWAAMFVPAGGYSAPVAARLVEGEPVTRAHTGSESVSYTITTRHGEAYLLEVAQGGLDLVVSLQTPDGSARTYNSPLFRDESEYVLLEDERGTEYRITLFANESPHVTGQHTIRISRLAPTNIEREAWRHVSGAAAAYATGDRGSSQQALFDYQEAARLFQRSGNKRLQAFSLYAAAMLNYWEFGKWYVADDLAEQAASLYLAANRPSNRADAILLRAMTLTEAITETDDKQPVLDRISAFLEKSYEIHSKLGNAGKLAKIRYFNALSHLNAGRYEEAKAYYSDAAALFRVLDDWNGERGVLLGRAVINIDTGNSTDAIAELQDLYRAEIEKHPNPTDADKNFVGTVLDQLGHAHKHSGNIDDALAAYSRARDLHHEMGDLHGEAESLRGIGGIYLELGDLDTARHFLRQAEAVAIETNNGRVLGVIYTTLGNIEYSAANYPAASESQAKALNLAPATGPVRAHRQVLLARSYIALGEFDRASDLALQALAEARRAESPRTEADALQQVGKAWFGLDEPGRAIDSLQQAHDRYARLALTDGLAEVESLLASALAREAMRRTDRSERIAGLDAALQRSARSLEHVDRLLVRVSTPELRAYYGASRRDYYETHISLLLQRAATAGEDEEQFVAAALLTSERARARTTMDLLVEASVDLQQNIDPVLASDIRRLIDELSVKSARRERILAEGGVDRRIGASLDELSNDIAILENQLALKQIELRRSSKHYEALTAPQAISVSQIRRLIDPGSVMLQYYLAEDRSLVWIVTSDAVKVRELADRKTIDAAADTLIASLGSPIRNVAANIRQSEALAAVSELVLQPVADLVADKRIIVVADGTLNYLPFQTLRLSADDKTAALLASREVVALPSMSVLAALREREQREPPRKSIAIFADPVFNRSDPRLDPVVRSGGSTTPTQGLGLMLTTRSSLSGDLPRLHGTRDEALSLAKLVADGEPLVALGFDANRRAVLERDLDDYRILHFATHGKVDRESPALSALVLSRFDARGRALDGYLRLHDIYSLSINADLVVLSACETGLGTDIHGEGLVGLTQGFLYAGARSLLISLWDVPDRATAELMTRFYGHLINDGMRPAAALRQAQFTMSSDRRWRDPYFWSAFILLGDWQ